LFLVAKQELTSIPGIDPRRGFIVAKQKPAQGKKAPKSKPPRPTAGKELKAGRKRSDAPKPAAKAVAAVPAARKKGSSTDQKPTPTKKVPDKKTVARPAAVKPAPAAKQAKPAEKAAERGIVTKAVMTKPTTAKVVAPRSASPVGKSENGAKGKPPAKVAAPAQVKSAQVKTAQVKPKVTAKPAAPRVASNGHVAGVLQAARSVASRTNKVVEVEKERKSHLTVEELNEFRQILLDKRRELVDDMVNLEDEARRTGTEGGSASSAMPIHMADLGSDTWEQEFTLNLIEKERGIVREIDEALDRIEKKTYGTCLATGKAISKARLRVKPWAKYCIEYARKRELGLS
jgi:RNA polymerase-binding protein DksA